MLANKKIKDYLVLDLELKFAKEGSDGNKMMMAELRTVELFKNENTEIGQENNDSDNNSSKKDNDNNNGNEERVEIGIFGPQIDDDGSFLGGRIVIGKTNDKNDNNNIGIISLCCIILYYVTLHYITLYYIILYYISININITFRVDYIL